MEQHQVRRVRVVDAQHRCIGIVAQADLALTVKPKEIGKGRTERRLSFAARSSRVGSWMRRH